MDIHTYTQTQTRCKVGKSFQDILDSVCKLHVLQVGQLDHTDGQIVLHVVVDGPACLHFAFFQEGAEILLKSKLNLVFFAELAVLNAPQKHVFLLDLRVLEYLIDSIADNRAHLVLLLRQQLRIFVKFLSHGLVQVMHCPLQVLDDGVVFVFQLVHHKTHIEETPGTEQIHHFHHFPIVQRKYVFHFDRVDDFLQDQLGLQAFQVSLASPCQNLVLAAVHLVDHVLLLLFAELGDLNILLLCVLQFRQSQDDVIVISDRYFPCLVQVLYVCGDSVLVGQAFRGAEHLQGNQLLPVHSLSLVDHQDFFHQVQDCVAGPKAEDFTVVGKDVLLDDLLIHVGRLHGLIGDPAIYHFVEDDADGPDVGFEPIFLLPHHFGGHSDDGAQGGVVTVWTSGDHLGETQIHDLVDSIVTHNVVGLEVSMDNVDLMHCLGQGNCTERPVMICFKISTASTSGILLRLQISSDRLPPLQYSITMIFKHSFSQVAQHFMTWSLLILTIISDSVLASLLFISLTRSLHSSRSIASKSMTLMATSLPVYRCIPRQTDPKAPLSSFSQIMYLSMEESAMLLPFFKQSSQLRSSLCAIINLIIIGRKLISSHRQHFPLISPKQTAFPINITQASDG